MKCLKYHLTLKSNNRKTGRIPVSTSPANTCPTSCPFRGKGCYAQGGPIAIHWSRLSRGESGSNWNEFLSQIQQLPMATLYRHNQAGDLRGSKNRINKTALMELAKANKGKLGYTYTHYPVINSKQAQHNRKALKSANKQGFVINISAESLEQADKLMDLNIGPVVVTLPSNATNTVTPKGRKVIICPAIKDDRITCVQCKLCAKADRKIIIGFTAHGFRKNAVDRTLNKL